MSLSRTKLENILYKVDVCVWGRLLTQATSSKLFWSSPGNCMLCEWEATARNSSSGFPAARLGCRAGTQGWDAGLGRRAGTEGTSDQRLQREKKSTRNQKAIKPSL